ncbi:hypothetical protein GLOIN_2v1778494 [Rhizophagus irregularis DAOM 181602=DAOM 197198]|nr:hypothetical protein GLOIN_2v1778494 [Rhizophagus irregularis DAOM 181602=DAOM 197198]
MTCFGDIRGPAKSNCYFSRFIKSSDDTITDNSSNETSNDVKNDKDNGIDKDNNDDITDDPSNKTSNDVKNDKDNGINKDNNDNINNDNEDKKKRLINKLDSNIIDKWLNSLRIMKKMNISDVNLNSNNNKPYVYIQLSGKGNGNGLPNNKGSQKLKYRAQYRKGKKKLHKGELLPVKKNPRLFKGLPEKSPGSCLFLIKATHKPKVKIT